MSRPLQYEVFSIAQNTVGKNMTRTLQFHIEELIPYINWVYFYHALSLIHI